MGGQDHTGIDAQGEVVSILLDPRSHHGGGPVDHIETHGAHVFLVGDRAYKIKRAVILPYLDFSTPEKRLAMLARELELNRRFAPDLYLGIIAITRGTDGRLRLGGEGPAVEHALMLRRFDQSALLLERARSGSLDALLAPRLAAAVCATHAGAGAGPTTGGAARTQATITRLCANLDRLRATFGPEVDTVRPRALAEFERVRAVLDARAAQGHVRRCHGDLHLGNVVVLDGVPTVFDALEFDEDLATIDSLYDLAFLLMDLDRLGAAAFAGRVRDDYLRIRAYVDLEGLRALPLFLALRAGIRAMVHAERASQSGRPDDEAAARRYLGDCLAHLAPPAPRLIAVGGFSGTGKTTLARALAPMIGPRPAAIHLRSDVERKAMLGHPELERLEAMAYTPAATAKVYARIADVVRRALAAGQSVIVDAVFSRIEERVAIEAAARDAGAAFDGLWLVADPEVMQARVAGRRDDASDATGDIVAAQVDRGAGSVTWTKVDASGRAGEVRTQARRALGL